MHVFLPIFLLFAVIVAIIPTGQVAGDVAISGAEGLDIDASGIV